MLWKIQRPLMRTQGLSRLRRCLPPGRPNLLAPFQALQVAWNAMLNQSIDLLKCKTLGQRTCAKNNSDKAACRDCAATRRSASAKNFSAMRKPGPAEAPRESWTHIFASIHPHKSVLMLTEHSLVYHNSVKLLRSSETYHGLKVPGCLLVTHTHTHT